MQNMWLHLQNWNVKLDQETRKKYRAQSGLEIPYPLIAFLGAGGVARAFHCHLCASQQLEGMAPSHSTVSRRICRLGVSSVTSSVGHRFQRLKLPCAASGQ